MKTCKDCIHYEVMKTESSSYCLCSKAFEMSERRRHDSTIECEHFKDKSKIIELPCSIGDAVYVIITENVDLDGYRMQWGKETFVKNLPFNLNMFDQFGKTVFLSREEAQKKLEELK